MLRKSSLKIIWKASADGYNYNDRERTPNGMFNLKLKAGASGKANIIAKAGKANLGLPSLSSLSLPLRVQLQRAGTDPGQCWETVFTEATTQTVTKFKAKLP